MGNSVRLRALALVTAGILGSWSLAGAASADPKGDHADQGQHLGQTKNDDKAKDKTRDKAKDRDRDKDRDKAKDDTTKGDHGHHTGHAHAPGQQANPGHQGHQGGQGGHGGQGGQGPSAANGDPAGNNGTIKIAGPGDEVGHPSNNPHPGCTVLVEWFGFDEGADIVSTVSFAAQAPTADAVIGGTTPSEVFVGGDAAGGGTDLDGRQAYSLTFQGEPHPKQGYHVKVTVATPRSLGNDTKTKVFWVEPCAASTGTGDSSTGPDDAAGTPDDAAGSTDDAASAGAGQGVLAETYTADSAGAADEGAEESSAAVPTAVDAGEGGVLPEWARSPLPLTLVSFVLVLVGAGMVLRNRARA